MGGCNSPVSLLLSFVCVLVPACISLFHMCLCPHSILVVMYYLCHMMLARDWKSLPEGRKRGSEPEVQAWKRSLVVYARLYIVCLSVHSSYFPFIYTSLYIGFV